MPLFLRVLIVAAVVALLVYFLRPRPRFVITVRQGKVHVLRGEAPPDFLRECRSLVEAQGIPDMTVRGIGNGRTTALRFSRGVPDGVRQRFRNVWLVTCG
jgi:hypothetical protein